MTKYSQRDPRWKDKLLGFSKTSNIGNYGCKLVSFASWADIQPDKLNEKFKKDGCFNLVLAFGQVKVDLLSDEACAKSLGWKFKERTTKNPKKKCIAEVDMSPSPGKQQHFLVYDYPKDRIFDPWTGTYRPINTYPVVTYRVFERPRNKKASTSSKNAPTTKETEKVVSTPKEETNPPKIEDYGTGDRTTPNEIVLDGTGTTGTEKSTGPSIVYTAKPLDPPTQSRLERIINWFLEKWDSYRNTLKR